MIAFVKQILGLVGLGLLGIPQKAKATIPHENIETNSRFTTKIDISSHMESLNFQSGNDETA